MNSRLKDQQKPNVLMLTSSFPNALVDETCGYIRDHARSLSSEFNVHVLAPADRNASDWPADRFRLSRSKSWLPEKLDPAQATCDFNDLLSRNWAIKFLSIISLLSFFKDALRVALRADAICSHWLMPSGFIGAVISRALRKPHIVIEHSGAVHMLARIRCGRVLARFIAGGSYRVITVSEDLKNKFLRLCPEAMSKMEVIPMGSGSVAPELIVIEPECDFRETRAEARALKRENVSSRRRSVLFLGRLSKVKGVDVLLKAVAELNDTQLLIAGDGEQRCELEELARRLSVDALFLGRTDAKRRDYLFSVCDAVVIPSLALSSGRTEGMPVVCLEAMSAGKPVIASRVGGLAEVIVDGKNGMLFNAGNHRALAKTLKLVLADSQLRKRLSANAERTAAEYRWPLIAARFNQIIKDSLTDDGPIIHDRHLEPRSADC